MSLFLKVRRDEIIMHCKKLIHLFCRWCFGHVIQCRKFGDWCRTSSPLRNSQCSCGHLHNQHHSKYCTNKFYLVTFICLKTTCLQAFRVPSTSSTTERSQVGIVTMTITVADINNNRPVILNPVATPLNVLEVLSFSCSDQYMKLW